MTDDTAALQAAVDASTKGRRVVLPAGRRFVVSGKATVVVTDPSGATASKP